MTPANPTNPTLVNPARLPEKQEKTRLRYEGVIIATRKFNRPGRAPVYRYRLVPVTRLLWGEFRCTRDFKTRADALDAGRAAVEERNFVERTSGLYRGLPLRSDPPFCRTGRGGGSR